MCDRSSTTCSRSIDRGRTHFKRLFRGYAIAKRANRSFHDKHFVYMTSRCVCQSVGTLYLRRHQAHHNQHSLNHSHTQTHIHPPHTPHGLLSHIPLIRKLSIDNHCSRQPTHSHTLAHTPTAATHTHRHLDQQSATSKTRHCHALACRRGMPRRLHGLQLRRPARPARRCWQTDGVPGGHDRRLTHAPRV